MQWQDRGIVLRRKVLGENAWIVTVLTKEHGLHKGVTRHGCTLQRQGRTARLVPTTGDFVTVLWTARLAEQLGTWKFDLDRSIPPLILRDPARLRCLMVFGELLSHILTERTPCPDIFDEAERFLEHLKNGQHGISWAASYLLLELIVLKKVGFGLDFRDAALATDEDPLTYVSPKTGRVVTRSKGEPYRNHLLRLPEILKKEVRGSTPLLQSDFQFAAFFLKQCLLPESYTSLYEARDLMIRTLGLPAPSEA